MPILVTLVFTLNSVYLAFDMIMKGNHLFERKKCIIYDSKCVSVCCPLDIDTMVVVVAFPRSFNLSELKSSSECISVYLVMKVSRTI